MTVAPKHFGVIKPLYSIVTPTIERREVEVNQLSLFPENQEEGEKVIDGSIVTPTIEDDERPKVHNGCIGTYSKGKNWYYRYTYKLGKKYKHKHIGPLGESLALRKVEKARVMIAQGKTIGEILFFLS